MFSLSSIIRIYIIFSIVVMVSFFIMLTSVDVILEPVWPMVSSQIEMIYKNLYITVIVMSLTAIVTGIIVSIFFFDRGINKYKDFLRRFDKLNQHSVIRPSALRFPDQDEFGNLGTLLNEFLSKIDHYDQLKTAMAKSEQEKFITIAHLFPFPILVINTDTNEPIISYYNQAFKDLFLKKSVFIDNNGKAQAQYYKLENTYITNLTLKNEDQSPFLTEQQLNQLKHNQILWEKKHTFSNISFSELSGNKTYLFEKVHCVPINNELENIMSQMIYIFMNPQIMEKKHLSSEEP